MNKRESAAGKVSTLGGSALTPAKRGRPFGSTSASLAAAAASGVDASSPASLLLGPSLHLPSSFADQNNKRIVLALQSGLKSDLTWALNSLTVLSFKEKDDLRRDATPLAKIPGLLDALLQVVDDWRDITFHRDSTKPARVRSLGANTQVTGFGNNYETTSSVNSISNLGYAIFILTFSTTTITTSKPFVPIIYFDFLCMLNHLGQPEMQNYAILSLNMEPFSGSPGSGSSITAANVEKRKRHSSEWWFDEDGLFNIDDEGRVEKQQCVVAASNIVRNLSFMPDNEMIMAHHRHCLETIFQCLEDHNTEDEELITNALETIVNLAPLLDLQIFSSSKPSYIKMTEKRAVQAIMAVLGSSVKAWHCAAAELLGRLIINPDNEPFLLPSAPQIYKHLVDLLSIQAVDAQAAAVGALYNLAEVNMDCRLKLASERWAVDRLLKIIRAPHPVPEVCRKSAMILESLVSEPQNRAALAAHETTFSEILLSDGKYADIFARILNELASRPNNKLASGRAVWGM